MTVVINLYGSPGTGKSTTAAHLFAIMKHNNISCVLVREYAKELVWEDNLTTLEDYIYVFATQLRRIRTLMGKVDYIITDSPVPLVMIYAQDAPASFYNLVDYEYSKFNNINIFLHRGKPYHTAGRTQTEEQSDALVSSIEALLRLYGYDYIYLDADNIAAQKIYNYIFESYTHGGS